MSSTSEQKFQSKKINKKYQKFKTTQTENTTSFVEEKADPVIKYKNVEKGSFRLFDSEDFPALKIPGKYSSRCKNFESNKKPVINYECKITGETSLALSDNKSFEKDAGNESVTENHLIQTLGGSNVAGTIKEKISTSKKASGLLQRNPNKKKRTDPIFINFQDILTTNKIQRIAKHHKIVKSNARSFKDKEILSGNLLDASNPKRNKGKHREIKKKKLTNFKTTIIKERIIKHKMKEKHSVEPYFADKYFNLVDAIDFKTEIKIYLNELNKKKFKSLDNSNNKLSEGDNVKKKSKKQEGSVETKLSEKTQKDLVEGTSDFKEEIISSTITEEVKFSSKFREYCDNIVTPDLNAAVSFLIKELIELQDRQFSKDPVKAKARKRHVSGIREVRKYLTLKKVKMIVIAPNLEKLQMEGSVYDSINQLKSMAENQNVPCVFALDRYKLGKYTKKNVPVSAFAVLNYEGIETLYENALRELREAKRKFSELTHTKKEEKEYDISSKIISSLISSFREELQMSNDAESQSD